MQPGSALPPPIAPPRRASTGLTAVVVVVVVAVVAAILIIAAIFIYLSTPLIDGFGPGRPTVALSALCGSNTSIDILVSESYPAVSPTKYIINMEVGSDFGIAQPAPATRGGSVTIDVSGGLYPVTWLSPGVSGNVSTGDHFIIPYPTGAHAPPSGAEITFYLIWAADGAIVTQVSFTVATVVPGTKPEVITSMVKIPDGVSFSATCVRPAEPPTDFKVNIQNGTSLELGTPVAMPTTDGGSVQVTVSGVRFAITWHDLDGSGSLSPGDTLVVTYTAAVSTHWTLLLIWAADGSVLPTNTSWVA